MKKLILSAAIFLAFAFSASAQIDFGIIGGATFSSADPQEWKATEKTMYHAGATVQFTLSAGFSIQPSLLYQVKGTKVPASTGEDKTDVFPSFCYSAGFLELPVAVQWGPDLIVMRPFVEVVPFIGYALNNKFSGGEEGTLKNSWTDISRFEYGVGFGGGVEVWKFQLSARYNWNIGPMFKNKENPEYTSPVGRLKQAFDRNNFGGVTLSLAFLF